MTTESKEQKEFKHFCDNPNCPNHNLELNGDKHYHVELDNIGVGGICGILQTHPYKISLKTNYKITGFSGRKLLTMLK